MKADLVSILSHLSQNLLPVQALISGLGYLIGIIFMIVALQKLRQIGDARARGGSQEKMFIPLAYILGSVALIFLPSMLKALSNTAFGSGNVLQYTQYNPLNMYSAVKVILQTAGLIWFVRGSILLVHASEPNVKEGPKGLAFLFAGILAMNFEGTMGWLAYVLEGLMSWMRSA